MRLPSAVEDIRQETLLRVLEILRQKGGIQHPERFGAFVNSVCNNVLMEYRRSQNRMEQAEPEEAADPQAGPDLPLVEEDLKRGILRALEALPPRHRDLLRCVFLEETGKEEVCRRYGVDPAYLRVLLHRAKAHFRAAYLRRGRGSRLKSHGSRIGH
ncbi:MAG: RNA polymerase sigma factor [Bryobacteraceae bacterium]